MSGGAAGAVVRGRVTEFDDHVGLGTVTGPDGACHPFHCTQIADGTRTIPVGTAVEYSLAPAHGGRWEAVALRRVPA